MTNDCDEKALNGIATIVFETRPVNGLSAMVRAEWDTTSAQSLPLIKIGTSGLVDGPASCTCTLLPAPAGVTLTLPATPEACRACSVARIAGVGVGVCGDAHSGMKAQAATRERVFQRFVLMVLA